MALSLPNDFTSSGGLPIDPVAVMADLNTIVNKINGNLGNTEFNSGDPLAVSKLATPNFHYPLRLTFNASPAGWPGSGGQLLDYVPLIGSASPAWAVTDIQWVCNDTGTGDAQFQVVWGFYSNGSFTTTTNLTTATTITNSGSNSLKGNQGDSSGVSTAALTFPNAQMVVGLISASAAKSTVCVNYPLVVVVDLKTNLTA